MIRKYFSKVIAKLAGLNEYPTVPTYTPSAELLDLAEENPLVAELLSTIEGIRASLFLHNSQLREAYVHRKIDHFDDTNIVMTPRTKDLVHDFLMDAPIELHDRFWEIMGLLKSSSGVLFELGQRGGVGVFGGKRVEEEEKMVSE